MPEKKKESSIDMVYCYTCISHTLVAEHAYHVEEVLRAVSLLFLRAESGGGGHDGGEHRHQRRQHRPRGGGEHSAVTVPMIVRRRPLEAYPVPAEATSSDYD